MKKLLAMALIAAMTAVTLCGCGGSDPKTTTEDIA